MSRMKLLLAAAFASGMAASSPALAQSMLKFSWQLPLTNYASKGADGMAKCIEAKAGGLKIETYPAGQLFKANQLYEASRNGSTEMAMLTLGSLATTDPTADVIYLPFMLANQDQMFRALKGDIGKHFDAIAKKAGIRVLAYFAGSGGQFGTKEKALRTTEDWKGQKIRVPGAVPAEVVKSMGGVPATIAATEVYMALQTGTVDGTNFPLTSFYDRKLYEVTKFLTLADVSLDPDVVVINERTWSRLDKTRQDAITGCAAEAEKDVRAAEAKLRQEYIALLREKGMQVIELSPEQRAAWRKATESIVQQFVAKNGPEAQKLVDSLRKIGG
jgi:tripartite ATP-independent transporter DctP family solute receptor